jgi:hypothetical protein
MTLQLSLWCLFDFSNVPESNCFTMNFHQLKPITHQKIQFPVPLKTTGLSSSYTRPLSYCRCLHFLRLVFRPLR